MTAALELECLTAGYDGVPVIRDLSLSVEAGEIVALMGPNGAGKSTTLRTISGLVKAFGGHIRFGGALIDGVAPHRLARSGLVLVPEGRGLVPSLTVADNLRLIGKPQVDSYEIFPALKELVSRKAGLLSGGEQQMLALARAIAMGPTVLLIDELSLGLAPVTVRMLLESMRELAIERRLSILLVEQQISRALAVADRAYILAHGRVVLEGEGRQLLADRRLLESYYMGDSHTVAPGGGYVEAGDPHTTESA